MATELSLREAFDRLVAVLNEQNLGWLVTQVEEQIRLGKPTTRRVKELKLSRYRTDSEIEFRTAEVLQPGREVQFRATEAYTDSERLGLLLSAIHQAIISTAVVAKTVAQNFPGLVFVSEQDDHRFAVGEFEREERLRAVERLRRSLDEVRTHLD